MKTEVSREDLLSFLLLDKDRQVADLEARAAELKKALVGQALQTWIADVRKRYEMGPEDQISMDGKIIRKEVANAPEHLKSVS